MLFLMFLDCKTNSAVQYMFMIYVLTNSILSVLKSAVENMLFLMFLDCKTNSAIQYIFMIYVLTNNILSVLKSAVENVLFLMFLDCKTNSAVRERDLNKMAFVFEIWESTTAVFVSLTAGICGPN